MQMLIIIAAGVFGGYKLDKWLDNQFPILLIILSTLAMITAIYHAIKDFI